MVEIEKSPKLEANDPFVQAVLNVLDLVCLKHREMGDKGRDKDVMNQFGEQALRADLVAEQTVVGFFCKYVGEKGITLEIRGEETGISVLGDNGEKYFAVLDGLDGSSNYLDPHNWPYGTMFTIAKGDNPTYKDFEVAGIGLPEENWVLIAIKRSGVFVYDINNQKYIKIKPFNSTEYDEARIFSDNYFPEAKKMLGSMQESWPRTGSAAASIVAIAIGEQIEDSRYPEMNRNWQGLADITRKGNLEQPALYLILSELGGVMVDKDGKDIGDHPFKEFGQSEKVPVISAKSGKIAEKILSQLTL